ncbi:putative nucleoredoxin 1 [Silene latifolia]|uniref:putative nucleoredoxin 1 n=1 Tax=Silene latifolia TaxID=37657 RepID=UPI003D786E41
MIFVEPEEFNDFLTMMGKDYFFPNIPLLLPDEDNDAEREEYFPSKLNGISRYRIVVQYPDVIHNNVTNFDYSNFDVVSFLSTDKRDYLIRNDKDYNGNGNYNQVKVASLSDKKWIMVCCFACPLFSISSYSLELRAVSSVCSELYECYGDSFEMVLVFKMTEGFLYDESAFRHQLSGFHSSCLAVPFFDSVSSDCICRSLGFSGTGKGIFCCVDERKVIWHKDLGYFNTYGVDAFPFTDEANRIVFEKERKISWNDVSLENLLCHPSFLYKNPRSSGGIIEVTTIDLLKEKLVGVYLCMNGDFIPELHEIYECCKAANKVFEIVVVYMPFMKKTCNPQLFQAFINHALETRKISWWVLPFESWVSRRLSRLIPILEDELIIVGKGFVDPYCAYVVQKFGMPAYPFSRKLMFKKEIERISKVGLASLLVYEDIDYVLRKDNSKVPVASLVGKNIFIFVDFDSGHIDKNVGSPFFCYYSDIKGTLLSYYPEMKARDPELEVIYVGSYATLVCTSSEIPWLVCPYDSNHFGIFAKKIFVEGIRVSTLVAIKKDGMVGSIQAHKHLSSHGSQAFPFNGSQLRIEVMREFELRYPRLEFGYM